MLYSKKIKRKILEKEFTPVNSSLGKMPCWKDSKCARCGRTTSETILNIEAVIHHNEKEPRCVDTTSCKKHKKKAR